MTQSSCKRHTKSKSHPSVKLAPVRVFSCKHPLNLSVTLSETAQNILDFAQTIVNFCEFSIYWYLCTSMKYGKSGILQKVKFLKTDNLSRRERNWNCLIMSSKTIYACIQQMLNVTAFQRRFQYFRTRRERSVLQALREGGCNGCAPPPPTGCIGLPFCWPTIWDATEISWCNKPNRK